MDMGGSRHPRQLATPAGAMYLERVDRLDAIVKRDKDLIEGMEIMTTDFYAWTKEQAALLRSRDLDRLDCDNVAEELEDLGRSEQRQLQNRLAVLLQHMLKLEHPPEKASPSWTATIKEQRRRVNRLLEENPSLRGELAKTIAEAYQTAVTFASAETLIVEEDFPSECPWTVEEIL